MSEQALDQWRRLGARIGCVAAPLLFAVVASHVYTSNVAFKESERRFAAEQKERIRSKIIAVKDGRSKTINLSGDSLNNFEMTEFVAAQEALDENDDYQLVVSYAQNTDDFLRQISGLRGVRSLSLLDTDVTDEGLKVVTAMPNLKAVSVTYGSVTDAGLEKIRSSHLIVGCIRDDP